MGNRETIRDSSKFRRQAVVPSHHQLSVPTDLCLLSLELLLVDRSQCWRRLLCSAHVQFAFGEGKEVTLFMLKPPAGPPGTEGAGTRTIWTEGGWAVQHNVGSSPTERKWRPLSQVERMRVGVEFIDGRVLAGGGREDCRGQLEKHCSLLAEQAPGLDGAHPQVSG